MQSVERVIDLLELPAGEPGEVPLARLAAASGLPPSTVHRLMSTLVARGYARRLPSRAFVLGPRLIHLGERSASTLGLLARPHLAGLVDEIGETAPARGAAPAAAAPADGGRGAGRRPLGCGAGALGWGRRRRPTLGEGRRRGSLTGLSSPAPRPG